MKDPVNAVLVERQGLEGGFGSSLVLSAFGHGFLLAGLFVATLLPPPVPKFEVFGMAEPVPRGGRGTPNVAPSVPAPAPSDAPKPPAEAVKVPEPPKILKPPVKDEPKHALPDPDAKKTAKTPAPRWTPDAPDFAPNRPTTGGAGQTLGLEFAPDGTGVPTGLATGGDFYMASVQQKIWTIWMQQVHGDHAQVVSVMFTIMADGSVTDVQVTQSSGASLLDSAAKRAVMSAGPFRPLPKTYGTDRITIRANFKPTS